MNAVPSWALWLEVFGTLAAGGVGLVAAAMLVSRGVAVPAWQKTAWQACVLGMGLLLAAVLCGIDGLCGDWFARLPATLLDPTAGTATRAQPFENVDVPEVLPAEQAGELSPLSRVDETASSNGLVAGSRVPGIIWLLGSAILVVRLAVGRVLLAAFARRQAHAIDATLLDRVARLAGGLGLRRRVRVLQASEMVAPAAFGLWRPTIVVPAGFTKQFTPQQQEVMLAHEMGHLAGGDPAWQLLAEVVTALWWWHPAAWWARRQLRAASELAADEASTLIAGGPPVLAACLLDLGERLTRSRRVGWLGMAGGGFRSCLGRRVERLLELTQHAWRRPSWKGAVIALGLGPLVLVALVTLTTAWARAQTFPSGDVPMNQRESAWRRSLAGLVVLGMLSTGGAVVSADDPAAPGGPVPVGGPPGTPGSPAAGVPALGEGVNPFGTNDADVAQRTAELESVQKQIVDLTLVLEKLKQVELEGQPAATLTAKVKSQLDAQRNKAAELKDLITALEAQQLPRTRIFRLQHRDPEEVRQVLESLLGLSPQFRRMGSGSAFGGTVRGRSSPGGMPGTGMGMPGGFAGGEGGMMGASASEPPLCRIAADPRTNSLIVRGVPRDLQTAADLIRLLDTAPGKPLPSGIKNVRAFALKHAEPADIVQVIRTLGIVSHTAALQKGRMLLATGSDAALKEVAEVVEALDVAARPEGRTP